MGTEKSSTYSLLFPIIKTVIAVIAVTFVLLFLLAFLLYKFRFSDNTINTCIIGIYAIANLTGGLIIGKVKQEKKFLWGFLTGFTYFVILSIATFIALKGFYTNPLEAVTAFAACVGGGMIGGMLA